MNILADLQIHSRYSRACSKDITLAKLEDYAKIKGITLLGTGDFQHPKWNNEIKSNLKEDSEGILWSKTGFPFLWQTEVSLMYSQGGRRAIHHLIFAPGGLVADQIVDALGKKGRLDYDGRPIFGMSSVELVEIMKEIDDKIEIIPAHCMTPFFGLFGSKSGFDSLKDCFEEKRNKIYAIETGMSADPPMLWRLKENVNLVSFSDAHSFHPWRLGREVTLFDCSLSYNSLVKAIRTGDGLKGTIETIPGYGKYHYDGHRNCGVVLSPKESKKLNGICPKCKRPLTLGVEYRIEELAKEPIGYKPRDAKLFYDLIPLHEIIAAAYNVKQLSGKKVNEVYTKLIKEFGTEFNVLLNAEFSDLNKVVDAKLANVILKLRMGDVKVEPGYDGVYGRLKLDDNEKVGKQKSLMDF